MAGTIPLSMTQQFDEFGEPLNGGNLFIIVTGTVSNPQNAFQDYALTVPLPYPIPLDAAGRIPQFFLADGTVKIRLEDRYGVTQLAADSVLVIGPPTIIDTDPGETLSGFLQLGDMIMRYGVGARTGFVRCNGLSIGSEFSGATERANPDCQNLFQYLWATDPTLAVIGGRGSSAFSDWAADKQIALPDWRGYAISGLDDMGNVSAGRLPGFPAPTTLGSAGGSTTVTIGTANLPPYTPSGSIANGAITSTFTGDGLQSTITLEPPADGVQFFGGGLNVSVPKGTVSSTQAASSFTGNAQGGSSSPFSVIGPRKLTTIYLKL